MDQAAQEQSDHVAKLISQYRHDACLAARLFVRRYRVHSMSLQEVEGAAMEGLWRGAQRFNPEHGTKFWSFARRYVFGAMLDELRRSGTVTRAQHAAIRAQLLIEDGVRDVHPPAVQNASGEDAARRYGMLLSLYMWKSSTATAYAVGASSEDLERVESQQDDPETLAIRRARNVRIRTAISQLPERQRHIIERHYFHDLQFVEISNELGKAKSTISRQLEDAHEALRAALKDDDLE